MVLSLIISIDIDKDISKNKEQEYDKKQIIVHKTNHYKLIDNYLIKDDVVIDIKNCKIIED